MVLPAGVTTCLVSKKAPVSFGGGQAKVYLEVTPSVRLVHTETGTPLVDFLESVAPIEGGVAQMMLPHTDQAGFQDEAGNAFTNWHYTARVRYEKGGDKRHLPLVTFQIPTGQTEIDLSLIPAGPAALPTSAPIAALTSFEGRTGAVSFEESDLPTRLSAAELSTTYAQVFTATGTTTAADINAWLATPSKGVKRLHGAATISTPLIIPADTDLDASGATITLAAGSAANTILSNAAVTATETRDANITVRGGTWISLSTGGVGTGLHCMLFRRVDGLRVTGLSVETVGGKYAINVGDVTDFEVDHITFDSASDGLHINGPATKGRVHHVRGYTHDDTVAITANDYVAYADVTGNVTDVEISDVLATGNSANLVKALAGTGTTIDDIRIRNVRGTCFQNGVWIGDDVGQASTSGGTYGTITVSDVETVSTDNNKAVVRCKMPNGKRLLISDIRMMSGNTRDVVFLEVNAAAVVERVTINDIVIYGLASKIGVNVNGLSGSSVSVLDIGRARIRSGGATRLLYVAGMTIPQATISDAMLTTDDTSTSNWIEVNSTGSLPFLTIRGGYVYKGACLFLCTGYIRAFLSGGLRIQGSNRVAKLYGTSHSFTLADVSLDNTLLQMFYIESTGTGVSIFGTGGERIFGAAALVGRSATQPVRVTGVTLPVDVSTLTPSVGDTVNNTNAALACGVGPVITNGTLWKNLYSGAST